ncbi:MAG: hypothetical protein ACP6IQ_02315 [Candidatus Njordarchaeia archaeon]
MGKLVKQKHLNLYKRYTEQLIQDLAMPVILGYNDVEEKCNNCIYDNIHKCSLNKYNGSGPKPFTGGICPVCDGKGVIYTNREVTINCTVNWVNLNETKDFKVESPGQVETGYFKIKTLVSYYEDIKNADYLIIDDVRCRLLNIIKRGLKEDVVTVAYCIREN